jgi:tetratricopeptide (TPR) repeat protein
MIKKYIILICITFFFNNISFSKTISDSAKNSEEPDNPVKTSDYNLAKIYIRKADKYDSKNKVNKAEKFYKKALKLLHSSNKNYQPDTSTFNYLGYVSAKLGNFGNAEIYYILGLELDPSHNAINKNLGQLYVDSNRIDNAKERLNILKNCNCEEFKELSNSIKLGASK